ncbi:hypothetical protein B4064_1451 [Caldibacillus thermoamylovorans]|uniref:copper homeostasis protein CutC n=1 Tax=Caldibacillus thermoamylovorans TaxID=35841 RepID=UPI0005A4B472|nr:copper homeostasis protein CutC [Caldibacillus thermoamylovorans]KIO69013.1 hypothetical protein B4064_1451 [Caldibacillus thermoamylovorans]
MKKIEVITMNVRDTLQAEELGVDRVELVSAMKEGGLTPSYGTIKNVLAHAEIPVQIMVRPHSYSFVYDQNDWNTIKEDILVINSLGGNRIVFGCITPTGAIDESLLLKVIELVPDLDITFHRAFDSVSSQIEAYKILSKYKKNVKRVLTSGGRPTAFEGSNMLKKLVTLSQEINGPEILVGAGVTPDNIADLDAQIHANEYHIGSGVRVNGDFSQPIDKNKIQFLKNSW